MLDEWVQLHDGVPLQRITLAETPSGVEAQVQTGEVGRS